MSTERNIEILTKDDVLEVARKFAKDNNVEVEEYNLNPYSVQKLGHMASHFKLVVTFKRQNTSEQLETCELFVKAILQNSQAEIEYMENHGVFEEEYSFFHNVKPLLIKNYKDEAWSPTCYLANKKFIVMEDLKSNEFKMMKNLLDKTSHIKSALKTLAKFHACSIVAEARLSEIHKKSILLNEHFPNNFGETFFTQKKFRNILIDNAIDLVFPIAEHLGLSTQNMRKIFDKIYEVVKPSKVYRNVISHSDLWENNVMFDDTEPEPNSIFVDFQTVRYAPNVLDILQFLYLNTTASYRKQYEQDLLKFYWTTLEATVINNDETKTAIAPTFDEILEAYENLRFYGAAIACIYLPFILLDQKKMAQLYNGTDGFSSALYSDRTEATFAYMKENALYKNRIEEVVYELVDIADHSV